LDLKFALILEQAQCELHIQKTTLEALAC